MPFIPEVVGFLTTFHRLCYKSHVKGEPIAIYWPQFQTACYLLRNFQKSKMLCPTWESKPRPLVGSQTWYHSSKYWVFISIYSNIYLKLGFYSALINFEYLSEKSATSTGNRQLVPQS